MYKPPFHWVKRASEVAFSITHNFIMIPPDDPCSYKMAGVFSKMHGHQSYW